MSGTLYIVATPIGNLSDLTPRAASTFEQVDFIAAEDTRVTVKLLNHLGIKKPMVSYYEHNLKERGDQILARIEAGESCALCSDAGMPAVSDPGELIVKDAHARGIRVVPVPAASAAVTALCVSGQMTGRWVFEGFLPVNRRQKKERGAHGDFLRSAPQADNDAGGFGKGVRAGALFDHLPRADKASRGSARDNCRAGECILP